MLQLTLGTTTAEDTKHSSTVSEQNPGLPADPVNTVLEQGTMQSTMMRATAVPEQDPGLPMERVYTVSVSRVIYIKNGFLILPLKSNMWFGETKQEQ